MAEDTTATVDASAEAAAAETEAQAKVQAALDKAGLGPESGTDAPETTDDDAPTVETDATGAPKKADAEPEATDDKPDDSKPDEADEDSPTLTDRQREAMKQLGLTDEDVAPLGEKAGEAIDNMAVKFTRKMSELGKLQQQLSTDTDADPDAAGTTESEAAASAKGQFTEDDLDQPTDEDGNAKPTPILAKLNAMAAELTALTKTAQARQEQEQEATVDGFFAGLWRKGEKDEDVTDFPQFGKGAWSGLDEASPEHAARKALLKEATAIRKGYAFSHEDLSVADSLQKALAIVAQDQFREADQKRLAEGIKKRRKTATRRPGQRRSQPVEQTDDEKALAKIAAAQKRAGLTE